MKYKIFMKKCLLLKGKREQKPRKEKIRFLRYAMFALSLVLVSGLTENLCGASSI